MTPSEFREEARALVGDPAYLQAFERRLADGKAPAMEQLLWQQACEVPQQEEPQRKPHPSIFLSAHSIGQADRDPLAEKVKATQGLAPMPAPPSEDEPAGLPAIDTVSDKDLPPPPGLSEKDLRNRW